MIEKTIRMRETETLRKKNFRDTCYVVKCFCC